ncbi:LLM class flavin-dependent oxidoreductase [Frigoribacterium sp. CFBP 13707]|uniref:LLM class flavin-dependent oxidoreductase n=1 Tax=Frigoribacterium sp. CFBP 13707 TaxID=2775313 RepID=UPI0035303218
MFAVGSSAGASFTSKNAIAELAEARSPTRLWITEHHSMPGVSSCVPTVILARLTAHTRRLRLASGSVLLPNHAPLTVAEQRHCHSCEWPVGRRFFSEVAEARYAWQVDRVLPPDLR